MSSAGTGTDEAAGPRALPDQPLIGRAFPPSRNGLNLLRLILASAVIFHHGFPLLGRGESPVWGQEAIGGWAVIGFFALSGYLIAASRRTRTFGEYLTLRIARIYPAFLVCLAVTALVLAPLAWVRETGGISGFATTGTTPFAYVWDNLGLRMRAFDVAGTPGQVPYPGIWNGSLWSLYYEFLCYLVIGVLGLLGIFRRRAWPILLAWVLAVALRLSLERFAEVYGVGHDLHLLGKLLPFFLAGGVLQMARQRIGMHPLLALAGAGIFVLAVQLDPRHGAQIASIAGAYALLYVGTVIPSPAWVRRHDVSYGMYIYGFPVQQLILVLGGSALGYWGFSLLALVATVPFALASWFLVERPVIRRARATVTAARGETSPAPRAMSE